MKIVSISNYIASLDMFLPKRRRKPAPPFAEGTFGTYVRRESPPRLPQTTPNAGPSLKVSDISKNAQEKRRSISNTGSSRQDLDQSGVGQGKGIGWGPKDATFWARKAHFWSTQQNFSFRRLIFHHYRTPSSSGISYGRQPPTTPTLPSTQPSALVPLLLRPL